MCVAPGYGSAKIKPSIVHSTYHKACDTCSQVQADDPRMSRWTLSYTAFGRDWEFSWLARNLAPIKGQKIHWVSQPGSSSVAALELSNKGQIRFFKRPSGATVVTLTISYEVPSVLAPFANVSPPPPRCCDMGVHVCQWL
jgi:hypothetical protein